MNRLQKMARHLKFKGAKNAIFDTYFRRTSEETIIYIFRKFCNYNKLAHKHIYLNLFQASETI